MFLPEYDGDQAETLYHLCPPGSHICGEDPSTVAFGAGICGCLCCSAHDMEASHFLYSAFISTIASALPAVLSKAPRYRSGFQRVKEVSLISTCHSDSDRREEEEPKDPCP